MNEVRIPAEIVIPVRMVTRDVGTNDDGATTTEFVIEPDMANATIEIFSTPGKPEIRSVRETGSGTR